MNTKEIQKGNLFEYNGEVVEIDYIVGDDVGIDQVTPFGITTEELIPIQVTEELLKRIGFEEWNNQWYKGDLMIDLPDGINTHCFSVYIKSNFILQKKQMFIHNIQNLNTALRDLRED